MLMTPLTSVEWSFRESKDSDAGFPSPISFLQYQGNRVACE